MITDSKWLSPPTVVGLREKEIHLWRASLDENDPSVIQDWKSQLAQDVLARASRFVFPLDRDRYIVGRGILRAILGRYMRWSSAAVEFTYEAHGKPRLRLGDADPPIRFNVSHSGGLAVYAFSCSREIGIDIEAIQPDVALEDIAEHFFSSKELAEFRLLPPEQRREGFFLCWTRKEAYFKALGAGLTLPLNSFDVSLTPGMPERLISADSARWMLHSFVPAAGYAGAIVAEGKDWMPRFWNFSTQTPLQIRAC